MQYTPVEEGSTSASHYGSVQVTTTVLPPSLWSRLRASRVLVPSLVAMAILAVGIGVTAVVSTSESRHPIPYAARPDNSQVSVMPVSPSVDGATPAMDVNDTSSNSPNITVLPLSCRPCTLKECIGLHCDPKGSPYTCISGFARGGCSKTEAAWNNMNCDECCSMAKCSELAPKCGTCAPADCSKLQAICGVKRPYACLEGPSNGGCSDDADQWPQSVFDGMCTKCCDLTTCPPPPGCNNCTKAECVSAGKGCSAERHFACSAGASMGGCADSEDYWKKAEFGGMCTKCCDTVSCADLA